MTYQTTRQRFEQLLDPRLMRVALEAELSARVSDADWTTLSLRRSLLRPPATVLLDFQLRVKCGGLARISVVFRAPVDSLGEADELLATDDDLQFFVFPEDPALRELESFQRALQERGDCVVLSHRLGRRCVYLSEPRSENGVGATVWKLVRPKKLQPILENHRAAAAALCTKSTVALPEILSSDERTGAFQMELCDFPSLFAEGDRSAAVDGYRRAGAALRALHDSDFRPTQSYEARNELDLVSSWGELAMRVDGTSIENITALVDLALRAQPAVEIPHAQKRGIHRDFYDKQILVGPDEITLLDFDLAAMGDPALDVGNFLAHLRLRRLQDRLSERTFAQATEVFVEGYAVEDWGLLDASDGGRRRV